MAHLDHYPHAITTDGGECTVYKAVTDHKLIKAIKDSDGVIHPPTEEDQQLIQAVKSEYGEE